MEWRVERVESGEWRVGDEDENVSRWMMVVGWEDRSGENLRSNVSRNKGRCNCTQLNGKERGREKQTDRESDHSNPNKAINWCKHRQKRYPLYSHTLTLTLTHIPHTPSLCHKHMHSHKGILASPVHSRVKI